MATHPLGNVLVKRLLCVDQSALLLRGVENWEVYHKWVAFTRNYVLSDYLVGPRVRNLTKVKVGRQDVGLDLVVCDFACVQLHNEVFFEALHGIVFLQVGEYLL